MNMQGEKKKRYPLQNDLKELLFDTFFMQWLNTCSIWNTERDTH